VEKASATWPVPSDWCYVNNFAEPHRPRALRLPPGRGRPLRGDIEGLIEELKLALPAAFESEEYRNRKAVIQEHFKERQEQGFNALQAPRQGAGHRDHSYAHGPGAGAHP
jgi:Lon-like LonC helical domain